MGILTFKGGVHPYDGKELSKNSPVVKYLPKGDMAVHKSVGCFVEPAYRQKATAANCYIKKDARFLPPRAWHRSGPLHTRCSGSLRP